MKRTYTAPQCRTYRLNMQRSLLLSLSGDEGENISDPGKILGTRPNDVRETSASPFDRKSPWE
ncbi:MAG: hypothetical protein ILA34_01840 [Bacteroidaceae bacterium]|nr:hypothetical protein [Bacteroidaceae bacterium]